MCWLATSNVVQCEDDYDPFGVMSPHVSHSKIIEPDVSGRKHPPKYPLTPATHFAKKYSLWREVKIDGSIRWNFRNKDCGAHLVELSKHAARRTVYVDGQCLLREKVLIGSKLKFRVDNLECCVVIRPFGRCDFLIDGLLFEEARKRWCHDQVRLVVVYFISMVQIFSSEEYTAQTDELQLNGSQWCKTERSHFSKKKVNWTFTLKGCFHEILLEHSVLSGRKLLFVDGEQSLSLCEISIGSAKCSVVVERRFAAFHYDLTIDGVSFEISKLVHNNQNKIE